jgi:hypothetical protein
MIAKSFYRYWDELFTVKNVFVIMELAAAIGYYGQ